MDIVEQWVKEDSIKYVGLTIEEKARKAVEEMGEAGQIMKVAWMMEIEKALHAQIEECAKLVDKQAQGFQILVGHAPTELRGIELQRVIHSLEVSANQIRALAAPKEENNNQEKGD